LAITAVHSASLQQPLVAMQPTPGQYFGVAPAGQLQVLSGLQVAVPLQGQHVDPVPLLLRPQLFVVESQVIVWQLLPPVQLPRISAVQQPECAVLTVTMHDPPLPPPEQVADWHVGLTTLQSLLPQH
jgi:hypothetical protein